MMARDFVADRHFGNRDAAAIGSRADIVTGTGSEPYGHATGVRLGVNGRSFGLHQVNATRIGLRIDATGYVRGINTAGIDMSGYRAADTAEANAAGVGAGAHFGADLMHFYAARIGVAFGGTANTTDVDTARIGPSA
jgi:hypothetical protein